MAILQRFADAPFLSIPGAESDGIGHGGGEDGKKGDYSPFWGTDGISCLLTSACLMDDPNVFLHQGCPRHPLGHGRYPARLTSYIGITSRTVT